jgi:predicted amidohydrolase YtcJ
VTAIIRGRGVVGWPEADAVVLDEQRIIAVGLASELGTTGETIDHDGYLSAPRHDHHFHPFGYAGALARPNLKEAGSFEGLRQRLQEAVGHLSPGQALTANRLDDEALRELRLPTRWELDSMVGDTPVLLNRYCGHIAVANSATLALAGLADHPDGILREEEIAPVANAVATRQPPIKPIDLETALAGLAALGLGTITAIVSAGTPLWCEVPDEVQTLVEVAPRVPVSFEVLVIADDAATLRTAASQLRSASTHLSFLGWKEFADGALGGRTAALFAPFADDPGNVGILRLRRPHADQMAMECLALGGRVAIHAIGDRANDAVLDLYSDLIARGADPGRLRIEHASVLSDRALETMARLGITASVQPSFITSEVEWLEKRLGERVASTYALGRMKAAGIPLLGGSDCPVESPNPWEGMSAARSGGLDAASAYQLYGPALGVGAPSHLIVIDRDPLRADRVQDTSVIASYRYGRRLELVTPPAFN